MLLAALMLFPVARSMVLVASGFLAMAIVEVTTAIAKSPIGSIIDASIRHSYGGDG